MALREVFLKINGDQNYLWRAVDQHGNVLDILVQSRRNKAAAGAPWAQFFPKLLKGEPTCRASSSPGTHLWVKLGSYEAAKKEVTPSVEYRRH